MPITRKQSYKEWRERCRTETRCSTMLAQLRAGGACASKIRPANTAITVADNTRAAEHHDGLHKLHQQMLHRGFESGAALVTQMIAKVTEPSGGNMRPAELEKAVDVIRGTLNQFHQTGGK